MRAATGRTRTAAAREAILEYIENLEDHHLADARARRNGKTRSVAAVCALPRGQIRRPMSAAQRATLH
jgi:predicted DNA-binding protein